jgi:hypothetical protein
MLVYDFINCMEKALFFFNLRLIKYKIIKPSENNFQNIDIN